MCWGDRQQVKELQGRVQALRDAWFELLEYIEDDSRMGNVVEAIRFRARRALDTDDQNVA